MVEHSGMGETVTLPYDLDVSVTPAAAAAEGKDGGDATDSQQKREAEQGSEPAGNAAATNGQ